MNRTVAATGFVLSAALIGAAVAIIVTGRETSAPPDAITLPSTATTPPADVITVTRRQHIIARYRVAVTFPDRLEFVREVEGEVLYYDPLLDTQIVFLVTPLRDTTTFEEAIAAQQRSFEFSGNADPVLMVSDTRAFLGVVELFRRVTKVSIFVGQSCDTEPLLVHAAYIYDRTSSPEDAWITQADADFPQFEFAYRCPT